MCKKLRNGISSLCALAFILLTTFCHDASGQDSSYSRPPLTSSWDKYKEQAKKDPNKQMIELKKIVPGLVYDLRYATLNNFMKRLMYPPGTSTTFMRLPAATALKKVQDELNALGYGLKIFDAYRPYAVTVKFWELVKDERYVANPSKGSGHNRGVAIDLTVIDISTRKELDMGTSFDNFSDTAHHSFTKLSKEVLDNRRLLKDLMEKKGFRSYNEEWWHYSLPESTKYEILDLDFRKLNKKL